MKDLPHHMKKLNRNIIRSMHREEMQEELPEIPTFPETQHQKKKKAKIKMRDEKKAKAITHPTPDERNKIMKKGRVPVFDRTNNAEPKHARPSKKKTPRI
ncbi:MAG: hypothetical protein COT85_05700 [Chlamydiae bacterium CG10_big_fil_rev_8_21_14_0_10_42_34]|nr:MAG: hypothetical protein COT85_05700 [Chlamydiae bacterium CG10_big_fil_rev_8_21_14_0_10_42_34]